MNSKDLSQAWDTITALQDIVRERDARILQLLERLAVVEGKGLNVQIIDMGFEEEHA